MEDASTSPDLLAGRYRPGALIGAGGMAEVRRAEDARLGREVAVKVLRAELSTDPAFRRRFEREARAAARLSHPNVVAVYDVGEDPNGRPFIVMELMAGGNLAERLRQGPLAEPEAVGLTLQVLAALDAAHAAGIVHRDIKPANILFTPDGAAKVADFGIAKALMPDAGATDLTATNKVIGTPRYLPPERVEDRPATPASDLWGAGVVLHEALAGAYPFPGDTPLAAVVAAQRGQSTPLATLRPDVSPAVAEVAARAMSPDPAGRYASAAEMAGALTAAATGDQATALLDPPPPPDPRAAATVVTPLGWARPDAAPPGAGVGVPAWEPDSVSTGSGAPRPPWWRHPGWAAVAAVVLAVLLLALVWPGGPDGAAPAAHSSTTSSVRAATPVTQAPTTTTTVVTCTGLQDRHQALDQQQRQADQQYAGDPSRLDAVRQAIATARRVLDQQIHQYCGPKKKGDDG